MDILSTLLTENITISKSSFIDNQSGKNTISIMYSNAYLEDNKFINNYAALRTKNIIFGFSNVTIVNTDFS